MTTVLLDAYDSFTFNLYQYLCKAGADVQVFRNDKITLDEVIALKPRNIVLSPGPGHPREDPGICYAVIDHFAGKIPILGVCLGQQMMYEHYGGKVAFAGEIQHGKTGLVIHDGQGLYKGLEQMFPVTRYHSLAGDPSTLPAELEVTSWTANGIIMGVRHKTFAVEGVQYHPESILSANGLRMLENFLALDGGLWADNPGARSPDDIANQYPGRTANPVSSVDILARIFSRRQTDVAEAKARPGRALADLERVLAMHVAPPQIDFAARLRAPGLAVLAEIKRASPSRSDICPHAVAAVQAKTYADAGAAAISVLTEPHWFKGSVDDLRDARAALESAEARPAVLRKDFVFDKYQIAEARLAGADSVLLIVKMLSRAQLRTLVDYSRSLGMEPLVEVNDRGEMEAALEVGARVVGVNNRDLRSFKVDMGTTTGLADMVPRDVVLVALSGIASPEDVGVYRGSGVGAVLVGEALMRAQDKAGFIKGLVDTFDRQ